MVKKKTKGRPTEEFFCQFVSCAGFVARFLKPHERGSTGSVHENKRLNIEADVGLCDAAGTRNFLL